MPAPHWGSLSHGQLVEHFFVLGSQHSFARQSLSDLQHGVHEPLLQHLPEPQSSSPQHSAAVQAPVQHFLPAPHWASLAHGQSWLPHCLVTVLQHWPARQSAFDWHPATHEPVLHTLPAPQSAPPQHAAAPHLPPQHFWPPAHCASELHEQADGEQECVAISQHCPPRQSAPVQQLPGLQLGWATLPPPPLVAATAPLVPGSCFLEQTASEMTAVTSVPIALVRYHRPTGADCTAEGHCVSWLLSQFSPTSMQPCKPGVAPASARAARVARNLVGHTEMFGAWPAAGRSDYAWNIARSGFVHWIAPSLRRRQ